MNQPILRHICKIEYCAAYHLKSAIILPAQAKALVREPMPWQELPLVGLASLEVTDEVENGVRIYTSKLTATLCKRFLQPTLHSVFCLTDVQGNKYLLGDAHKPYPLINLSMSNPDKENNICHFNISVTLESEKNIFEISY